MNLRIFKSSTSCYAGQMHGDARGDVYPFVYGFLMSLICVSGETALGQYYSTDRLTTPRPASASSGHTRLSALTNVHSPDSFLPVDPVEVVSKRSIRWAKYLWVEPPL
jgi:hypothetical protein